MSAPTVSTPPNRNLTKEMEQILAGYQATAPGYLSLEERFAPQYAQQQLQLNQEFAPQNLALQLGLEQQGVAAQPELSLMEKQNLSVLQLRGALPADMARDVTQQTLGEFAQRGNAMSNQALASDVLNRSNLQWQRYQQELGVGAGLQQLSDVFGGWGTSATQGFNPLAQGSSLFNPQPQYASNLYSQNYGGQLTSALTNANLSAGWYGGLIGAGANVLGGALQG